MGAQRKPDTLIGILRRLGYVNYLLTPAVFVAVGMSGDSGGWFLPMFAITLAVCFLNMPWICSSLSKNQLAAGNRRAALIIAAIPAGALVTLLCLTLSIVL